jgi:hypothetical protein
MAIPIYISRVRRAQVLAPLQMPCPSCYQTSVHHVVRHYFSAHVYHLPMVSTGTEYEYICSNCRASRKGHPRGQDEGGGHRLEEREGRHRGGTHEVFSRDQ